MGLSLIKNEVQKLSDAIASVLGINVAIVDENLIRIAATGHYEQFLGKKVNPVSVFAKSMACKNILIVDNPKLDETCSDCKIRSECIELGQICCPIIDGTTVIGAIGLVAFKNNEKENIFRDKESVMKFLINISDLISTKLIEKRKNREVATIAGELEILLNSLEYAVVFTDPQGLIIRFNKSASDIFELHNTKDQNIVPLIGHTAFDSLKKTGKVKNEFFKFSKNSNTIKGLFDGKSMKSNEGISGYLLTFDKMNDVINTVNSITGGINEINFEDIIGNSSKFIKIKDVAKKAAKSTSTIIINGESGTGKELFARAIHFNSERRNKPFIPINCAAIPDALLESELFGYKEGAFTGAKRGGKTGKFELANHGTIFLDEIGDMQLHLQAKLLRVLQENVIVKVGGNNFMPIDVRIIAATNKELHEKVETGEFREDLFYRLNVIPIRIISLRDRKEDLHLLTSYFLKKYNTLLKKDFLGFDESVYKIFSSYDWPGNIRELENAIEYAVNMANEPVITHADLPSRFRGEHKKTNGKIVSTKFTDLIPLSVLEEREILKAISLYGTDRKAMEIITKKLRVSRATIYRKMKQYQNKIDKP